MTIDSFIFVRLNKPSLYLHLHDPLYTEGSSGFGFGLVMLSNTTSAFNANFECPTHSIHMFWFKYPQNFSWGISRLCYGKVSSSFQNDFFFFLGLLS